MMKKVVVVVSVAIASLIVLGITREKVCGNNW